MMSRFTSPTPLQGSFGYRPSIQRRLPPLQRQKFQQFEPYINDNQMSVINSRTKNQTGKIYKHQDGYIRKPNGTAKHLSLGTIRIGAAPSTDSCNDNDSQSNCKVGGSYVGLVTTPVPGRARRSSPRPRQQLPSHQRIAYTRSLSVFGGNSFDASDLSSDAVNQYLKQNPEVLDNFVASHVKTERIEKWLLQKTTRVQTRNTSISARDSSITTREKQKSVDPNTDKSAALSRWKSKLQASKGRVLQELAKDFHNANGKLLVLLELADCVAAAISADSHTLFAVDDDNQKITHISTREKGEILFGVEEHICQGTSLAASVAMTKEPSRLSDILENKRNPDRLSVNNRQAHSVLALPIIDDVDVCIGVIEYYRHNKESSFSEEEKEVAVLLLQWYDMLLDYVETHSSMTRQSTLSDFLLEVTRSIFQDIISMDIVIMKIMNFAKALVHADRASLFLLDTRSNELYARIFDDGYSLAEQSLANGQSPPPEHHRQQQQHHHDDSGDGGDENNSDHELREKREEWKKKAELLQKDIRFSMDKGVAGYVATTGKILNIKDAYKDKRFNREVDIQTGYRTKTILCMPIFIRKNVIGVVQMINKINGRFTKADEKAFETFAIYCGLALHHAKLYEKIRRSEQKYKVALEVLSYHSMATEDEVNKLRQRWIPDEIPNITKYNFSPWSVTNDDKPLHVLYMFKKLFNKINFSQYAKSYEIDDVMRFTLTIRKNYRDVPYHNWLHAFSVAHSMFTIIETAEHNLNPIEAIVLFVSCLCHDLDHRGKTNSFMVQSASPLAAIYSTSTMEHHHFNQTVSILQREDHNIFKFLSSVEYKKTLGEMKMSILATDLAVFFKNKVILDKVIKSNSFDWSVQEHRNALKAVMMTSCDLCAMYKPWATQVDLVYVIMEEFWQQGDEEKRRGITPVEMMDRDKKDELPLLEVGFIESICLPCYELMNTLMPDTEPMLVGAKANLEKWRAMADALKKKDDANDSKDG